MAREAGVMERVNYNSAQTLVKDLRVTPSPALELHVVFYITSENGMY